MDSMILCKFLRGVFDDYFAESSEILNLVTGWSLTREDLLESARSIINAKKEFNIASGWTPKEDTLPSRMLTSALDDDDQATLNHETLQSLIQAYNLARGWDKTGYLETTSL